MVVELRGFGNTVHELDGFAIGGGVAIAMGEGMNTWTKDGDEDGRVVEVCPCDDRSERDMIAVTIVVSHVRSCSGGMVA